MPTCCGVFERMPLSALPSALKWTEAASNICCNIETPVFWSFVGLPHLTVTYILIQDVTRHMLCNIFELFLSKISHYTELMREFLFALYLQLPSICRNLSSPSATWGSTMPTFHVRHIKTIIVIMVLIICEIARIGVKVHVRKISRFWAGRTKEN
jgi:hypothetical protein